jgi:hypothetical protein
MTANIWALSWPKPIAVSVSERWIKRIGFIEASAIARIVIHGFFRSGLAMSAAARRAAIVLRSILCVVTAG